MNSIIAMPRDCNYLAHHGVKGMKWGVRKQIKYEAKAQKYAAKEALALTTSGKNRAGTLRIANQMKADRQKAINNATTKKEQRQQKYGEENAARIKKAESDIYAMKAARSKTRLGRHINSVNAYNARSAADFHTRTASISKSTMKRVRYSMRNSMKVPMKTITGRRTTVGRQMAKVAALSAAGSALQIGAQMASEM